MEKNDAGYSMLDTDCTKCCFTEEENVFLEEKNETFTTEFFTANIAQCKIYQANKYDRCAHLALTIHQILGTHECRQSIAESAGKPQPLCY